MDYIVNKKTDGLKDIQTKQLGMKKHRRNKSTKQLISCKIANFGENLSYITLAEFLSPWSVPQICSYTIAPNLSQRQRLTMPHKTHCK